MTASSSHPLLDLHYPDFTARHVFTAKLRILILIGYWLLILTFYPGILTLDQPIMMIISLTFVVTTLCYFFILREIYRAPFFILELAADVAAQTVLIYCTGGPKSAFFTIYIIYCAAGGLFYNYRVSIATSILAVFFYAGLVFATRWGWLEPFSYPLHEGGLFAGLGLFQNLALLTVFLVVGIYAIRIASHFTKMREKALEEKNRELVARNRVSSLTRSGITLERVRNEVIRSVREGMGYLASFLLYEDQESHQIRVFVEGGGPIVAEMKNRLGFDPVQWSLPIDDQMNPLYQSIKRKKLIIRNELAEVLMGASPPISPEEARRIQDYFGFRKFVAAPLVAEGKVLGALIGVSRDRWIEPEQIRALQGFADQAALTIDNAMLIEELKQKNIELERVSRVKSEFLATMSHELRTPLTAIIGFSELLIEEVMGNLQGDQKESLREILVNGENLLQMINGLLDLAKIEAGRMEVSIGPIAIEDLLERVQRMVASLLQKKGHHFEVRMEKEIPLIYADERKIQQVLLNLLSNAIKFTPNGGKISVSVHYNPWNGQGAKGHDRLEIAVQDNGIGIQPSDLKTIFESFRQVDSSYTREYQGTGLGLALVRQLVELHGGKIWAESEVGKGATFTFSIPNQTSA